MIKEIIRKFRLWLIIGAALLLVNLAVFFFLTLPKINAEALNRNRLADVQNIEQDLQKALKERESIYNYILENQRSLQKFYFEKLGRKSEKLTTILKEREEIAGKFGVVPVRVRYSSELIKDRPLERFTMAFPLTGTYESMRFFVDTLEHSENFFIVEDVELESSPNNASAMSMRITVSTFFYGKHSNMMDEELAEGDE